MLAYTGILTIAHFDQRRRISEIEILDITQSLDTDISIAEKRKAGFIYADARAHLRNRCSHGTKWPSCELFSSYD